MITEQQDFFESPVCTHTVVRVVPTPETIHHAKEVCEKCGAFVRWLPKPETIERVERMRQEIKKLFTRPLSEWEKGFVASLLKADCKCSPKQMALYENLKRKHGI